MQLGALSCGKIRGKYLFESGDKRITIIILPQTGEIEGVQSYFHDFSILTVPHPSLPLWGGTLPCHRALVARSIPAEIVMRSPPIGRAGIGIFPSPTGEERTLDESTSQKCSR